MIFHVFHTPAIANHEKTVLGLRPATFRHLRDSGLSPARIAERGGRTRAGAQARLAELPAFMSHTYRTPSQQVSFLCRPH